MRAPVVGTLLATALLLAAPAQAQLQNPEQSTETTLYFHVFDTFNKFVINTQGMNADFFDVGGTNNPTVDGTPLDPIQEEVSGFGPWDLNTIYGTSTAGPVEYDFIEHGKPRFHPEPGIAQDVRIDETQPIETRLYLDLRDFFGMDGLPTVTPAFTVEVTMREGDDAGRRADLDEGNEIMHGKQSFHLADASVAPGDTVNAGVYWATWMTIGGIDPGLPEDGASANGQMPSGEAMPDGSTLLFPDEQGIVELVIPMQTTQGIIPKSEAFNIRVDWYQMEQAFGEDAIASGYVRHYATPEKQPHLKMNILNPVYIDFIHPQVAAGTLLIHAGVNSPWGTYDVDMENIDIRVDGPSSPINLNQVIAQNAHVHGLHDKSAEITYLWDFRAEGAEDGDYTITMTVPNMHGTATATGKAGFTIEGKQAFGIADSGDLVAGSEGLGSESRDSPSFGGLALVGLLGAALVARRSRA